MAERTSPRPFYADEGSKEHEILANAEKFFAERDEKLRYGLVKRVFQWMLDTDENGFFEPMYEREEYHPDGRGFFDPFHSTVNRIRPSGQEIKGYLRAMEMDTRKGFLTGEIDAMSDYLSRIEDELPREYHARRNHLLRAINEIHGGRFLWSEEYTQPLRRTSWRYDNSRRGW